MTKEILEQEAEKTYVKCNLCGADDARLHLAVSGFRIMRCNRCSLTYVNPRLNEKKIFEIYNKNYFDGGGANPYYANYLSERQWRSKQQDIELVDLMKYTANGGKLLEIGCAYGFFLEAAKLRGWEARGVEISEKAGSFAKNELKHDVFIGTFMDAPLPEDYFDAVHMDGVIEHLPDPMANIRKIAKLLKKGGVIGMGTPNIASFGARTFGEGFRLLEPNAHLFYFAPATLGKMLTDNGFEILHVRYPYFNTPYCNAKELMNLVVCLWKLWAWFPLVKLFNPSFQKPVLKSPPFYGNRMMIYARKK